MECFEGEIGFYISLTFYIYFMSEYKDRWTREKFIEYRKLKRSGWNDRMLIEHFGEDIYHSGLYNRRSSILPWLKFLTEITPEECSYKVSSKPSDFHTIYFFLYINSNIY